MNVSDYYRLTKPGIIRGNLITAAAGFLLASGKSVDIWLLVATLAGLALVVASACVFNNYLDRDIDKKMARTKKRAVAAGRISEKAALNYGAILGFLGSFILAFWVNIWAWSAAMLGLFFYVVVYGWAKRKTVHGTLVGSISGAMPPVVGYSAVAGQYDTAALLLFLILVAWQMPHFYAIAIYRLSDYKSASIPVLPAARSIKATKIQMILYVLLFAAASAALYATGYTGYLYLAAALGLSIIWLDKARRGFNDTDNSQWAKQMFTTSLAVITGLCLFIGLNAWLP